MITKEQEKDLILVQAGDVKPGYTFYRKEPDGSFANCKLSEFEFHYLKPLTEQFMKEKRLFKRRNRPGGSFVALIILLFSLPSIAQDSFSASQPRIDLPLNRKENRKQKMKAIWYAIKPRTEIKIKVHVIFPK